jgi:ssDNA thymidine ADP-ribosyltransferase, DarT
MAIPAAIWFFRITHVRNLPHILRHGLCPIAAGVTDPGFMAIGDISLIAVRKDLAVPIAPGGVFSEYVPFYLGPRSPMLYQIWKGGDGVAQMAQSDIVYIAVSLDCVQNKGIPFVFTDGHARTKVTRFYNDVADFAQLDWEVVQSSNWANTEDDPDRKRRKQAEIMIKGLVNAEDFGYLLTFDAASKEIVAQMVADSGHSVPVHVKRNFYYP